MTFTPDPHQLRAVNRMFVGNCILVWDPGCGKTWPAIEAARMIPGPVLAIVPAHLRQQWHDKVIEYAPSLKPRVLDGINDTPDFSGADFFICSYEYVSTVDRWRDLRRRKWGAIVIDEAHYLANQKARRTQAILGAKPTSLGALVRAADSVWFLTGTPFTFPNEIYPILSRCFPDAVDGMSAREWENEFCKVESTGFGDKIVGTKNVPELRRRLEPVLDKVRLSDVHPGGNVTDTVSITGDLTRLTAGLDPALLEQYEALGEILADPDIPDDAKLAELETCGLDMAQLRHNVAVAKVQSTIEYVKWELENRPGKIVVYGWHREPLMAVARALDAPVIQGGTKPVTRKAIVDAFTIAPNYRVLCGQISAIGTGTDGLQKVARRGIFMEQSWRYLENKQAIHRLFRRGQPGDTHHTFLSLSGSVDAYVARVMRRKAENVSRALD